jgi:hypothetical protein
MSIFIVGSAGFELEEVVVVGSEAMAVAIVSSVEGRYNVLRPVSQVGNI